MVKELDKIPTLPHREDRTKQDEPQPEKVLPTSHFDESDQSKQTTRNGQEDVIEGWVNGAQIGNAVDASEIVGKKQRP